MTSRKTKDEMGYYTRIKIHVYLRRMGYEGVRWKEKNEDHIQL